MNEKIYLEPSEVWQYYKNHTHELKDGMKLAARNQEYDTEIYITEAGGLLTASVYLENQELDSEEMLNASDTESSMKRLYEKYITKAEEFVKEYAARCGIEDEEDLIDERELELDDAAYDFLVAILGEAFDTSSKETQEVLEDVKDCICPMLYAKHGIEVYRPMYIADEDGNEEFCLYPYAEITETE